MKRIRRKKKGITWGLPLHRRCLSLSWNGEGTVVSGSRTHTEGLKNAIDFRLKTGSEVLASNDGVVVATASDYSVGGLIERLRPRANYVAIHHPSIGLYSRYYHLSKDGALVNVGDNVVKGQIIGLSGNTGYSRGPHLHFDVVQILPQHISCLQYLENGPQQQKPVETGISTGPIATWIPIPSIPASFSAPLPSLKERLVLKLVETEDCSAATALPLLSVAVLVDRDSKTSFHDMCGSAQLKASGSAGAIIVVNSNTGNELFQMVSSKGDSMSIACLLISQESAAQLRSTMALKDVWVSINTEPTSTVSADPDLWRNLRPDTQPVIFDAKPAGSCCHCSVM